MKRTIRPFAVEFRSNRKGSAAWPTPQPAVSVTSPVFAEPQSAPASEPPTARRILPALDQPQMADERSTPRTISRQPTRRARKPSPTALITIPDQDKIEAVRSVIADKFTKSDVAQTATSPSERDKNAPDERASRKSFRREQRWMHRLPRAINRKHLRP